MSEKRGMAGQTPRRGMASWSWVPPAQTGYQEEGTSILPLGRYRMPDGSQQVSFGLPQGLLDAYRGMRYGLGFEQDPNAPKGYVSDQATLKAAVGGAGFGATGNAMMRRAVPKGGYDYATDPMGVNQGRMPDVYTARRASRQPQVIDGGSNLPRTIADEAPANDVSRYFVSTPENIKYETEHAKDFLRLFVREQGGSLPADELYMRYRGEASGQGRPYLTFQQFVETASGDGIRSRRVNGVRHFVDLDF